MSLVTRKPVFGVCDQGRLKSAWAAKEARYRLEILDKETGGIIVPKALIRPLLFAYGINRCSHDMAHMVSLCECTTCNMVELSFHGHVKKSKFTRIIVSNCTQVLLYNPLNKSNYEYWYFSFIIGDLGIRGIFMSCICILVSLLYEHLVFKKNNNTDNYS